MSFILQGPFYCATQSYGTTTQVSWSATHSCKSKYKR